MKTIEDINGPWIAQEFESGLILRCKNAWKKPLDELSNLELATLLREDIAVMEILPIAQLRIDNGVDDDSEFYDGQLFEVVQEVILNS